MRPTLLLLSLFLCTGGRAQTGDSLVLATGPLTTVSAFGQPGYSLKAAATAIVTPAELQRYDQSSLLSGLNRVPGVRFEERATGSYRLAIRGASLRSPFGVRNTQVYWNGIPFGEPGGDVPLNFLDAGNVDLVEVLRGPSGGFYGPGTAGTLLLNTDFSTESNITEPLASLRGSATAGSFGFFRADLRYDPISQPKNRQQARVSYQYTDGYRDHSAMERITAQYSVELGKGRSKTALHALYTNLFYELPGGLNAQQYAENPRQARPGSSDKNASINYNNLLLGLTNERQLGKWKNETTIYATGFYFDHPFNFDYKRETNLGAGLRTSFRRLITNNLDLVIGGETKSQLRFGNNFANPDGTRPGALNFSDEIFSNEGLLFTQLRYLPGQWDFTLGLSGSDLFYSVDRTFSTESDVGETEFTASRPVSLRLAAGYTFTNHYLYASRADGFSPPTLDEFRTNEGSLNTDLSPEVGTNYELGYKLVGLPMTFEVTAFHFRLDEAISSFSSDRGTQLFRNAGETTQNGLEIAGGLDSWIGGQDYVFSFYGSYTYYDFTYKNFERDGTDVSGNNIPGAAPHTINAELRFDYKQRFSASLFNTFVDVIPLNDANDVSAGSYNLVRARVSYKLGRLSVFAAASNLLDERMSFGNDLNPQFGGRYFQPAPGRNFQVGVRML